MTNRGQRGGGSPVTTQPSIPPEGGISAFVVNAVVHLVKLNPCVAAVAGGDGGSPADLPPEMT